MMAFTLERQEETPCSTWGYLHPPVGSPAARWGHLCMILERGSRNANGHPRIPAGLYKLAIRPFGESRFDARLKEKVKGYRGVIQVLDGPGQLLAREGRTHIEMHPANNIDELQGCLAPALTVRSSDYGTHDFVGMQSVWAFQKAYPAIADAVEYGGAQLLVKDIAK